jgi:hypothetical protein
MSPADDGEHEARIDDDDDGYIPDPDAPKTEEGRVEQAVFEMQRLLLSSLQATGLLGALFFVIDLVRGRGFALSKGFVLGALVATVNLWLLSNGILQLSRGQGAATRGALTLAMSFLALVLCAAWVVFFQRSWTLGFALGLAIPAAAGMLYARLLNKDG